MLSRKILLLILCALVVALFQVFKDYFKEDTTVKATVASLAQNVSHAMFDATIVEGSQGKEEWILKAPVLQFVPNQSELLAEKPSVTYFTDSANIYIDAKRGIVETEKNFLRFEEDVQVLWQDYVLDAPLAEYSTQVKVLTFAMGATVTKPDMTFVADVMTWNTTERVFTGQGNVKVVFTGSPNKTMKVR